MLSDIKQYDVRQFSSDKILKHLGRINAWLKGQNPSPITVELDMTNICNHGCPECAVNYFRVNNSNYLSYSLAKDIIRQLAKNKIKGLIFTGGGEPLCNRYTLDALVLAKSKGLDTGFITNGSLINEKAARIILKSCTWVRVSLDAATPEVFKIIHGVDEKEFFNVVEKIALLVKIKKEIKSNCTIGVGFLTCIQSLPGMEKAAVLAKSSGVDYLQFRPMQIRNAGKFEYHWTDVEDKINDCLKHSREGFKVLFSKHKYDMMKEKDYGRNYGKCFGQQFATVIAADARLYICCHLRGYDKYCIGDLKKNSFREIWNSKQRKKVVENIDFRDCIPLCRDNTFNQVLWNIKQPREHVNFL